MYNLHAAMRRVSFLHSFGAMMSQLKVIVFFNHAGDISEEDAPVLILNSRVKLFCVKGTAWVTVWERKMLLAFLVGSFWGNFLSSRAFKSFSKIEEWRENVETVLCQSMG